MPNLIIRACKATPFGKDLDWVRDKRLLHMARYFTSKLCMFCGFSEDLW